VLLAFLRAVSLAEPLQRELAAGHGISIEDLYAVRVLARLGDVPISRYAAELGLARSTITNLVDRLERASLVERVAGPTDRRVTLVRLTPSGRQALEARVVVAESDIVRRLFALDADDQTALAELLERVAAPEAESEREPEPESDPQPEPVASAAPSQEVVR
jgi:DNA-binding MarR family transcriptional regulator